MHHGVIFNFGSARVCSPAIFETCFSYTKAFWIAATYYYMYIYIIVLFPLTAMLQLIIILQLHNFSLLINAVILLLNCLVLVLHFYIHFLSLRCYFLYLNIILSESILIFVLFHYFYIS